jgi:RNA polymerase sigma-70 factor (ECF subfamily)
MRGHQGDGNVERRNRRATARTNERSDAPFDERAAADAHREREFLEAIACHKGILYKVARVYCGLRDDRADLIQEIIAQLWRSYDRFDGRCPFSTWMCRVAINVAISFHRGTMRRPQDTVSLEDLERDLKSADARLDALGDDVRRLYQLIGELDDLNKAIILLHLEGYEQRDIAETVGITATNVSTRINRIRQKLRRDFDGGTKIKGKVS